MYSSWNRHPLVEAFFRSVMGASASYLVTLRYMSPALLSNCSAPLRSPTLFQKETLRMRMRIRDLCSCCRCKLLFILAPRAVCNHNCACFPARFRPSRRGLICLATVQALHDLPCDSQRADSLGEMPFGRQRMMATRLLWALWHDHRGEMGGVWNPRCFSGFVK